MDFNYLGHFPQHVAEDGSVNWDSFSFETVLEARKATIKEHLQTFKLSAEATALGPNDEDIITQLRDNKDVHDDLLKKNEVAISKHDTLVEEQKCIEEKVVKLSVQNKSLEKNIKDRQEAEATLKKDYHLRKAALQKGINMYCTQFDLNVSVTNISDTMYEAFVRFGKTEDCEAVKFVVDRTKKEVIDFDLREVLTPTEEEEMRKKFGNLDNLPGLLCGVREIVLSKQNNVK